MEGSGGSAPHGINSTNSRLRLQALYHVWKYKTLDSAEDVLRLMKLDPDPAVKGRCAWVLGRLRHRPSYPYLIANLKHRSPQVRIWSAWALGELGLDRAIKHLRAATDLEPEGEVRQAIGGALKKLAGIPTRIHRRKILQALKPPWTDDAEIMGTVEQLEKLTWSQDKDEILAFRARIRHIDPDYFAVYMLWLRRRPALLAAMDDDTIVFS